MPLRLDRELLYALYGMYRDDLRSLAVFEGQRATLGAAYHKEERRILYMMVRHLAPELIVEFSPKRGLSTAHMALALEHNGRGRVLSFELGYRHVRRAYRNLKDHGLSHRVEFILGDVREELPRALDRAGAAGAGIEFVFIDSDHGAEFARWYLEALVPSVRRDGIAHVHDILTDPLTPRGELPLPPNGEELEVRQFLAVRRDDYEWLSVGDCVHDPAYLATVRAFGGGDVALDPGHPRVAPRGAVGEWNPSLWLRKRVERESDGMVAVPFTPLRRRPFKALVYAWRQRRLARRQRR